jgi:hypothetical protein
MDGISIIKPRTKTVVPVLGAWRALKPEETATQNMDSKKMHASSLTCSHEIDIIIYIEDRI